MCQLSFISIFPHLDAYLCCHIDVCSPPRCLLAAHHENGCSCSIQMWVLHADDLLLLDGWWLPERVVSGPDKIRVIPIQHKNRNERSSQSRLWLVGRWWWGWDKRNSPRKEMIGWWNWTCWCAHNRWWNRLGAMLALQKLHLWEAAWLLFSKQTWCIECGFCVYQWLFHFLMVENPDWTHLTTNLL